MKATCRLVLAVAVGVAGIAVASSQAAFRDEVLARNPVGYWEFEGNLNDSSGYGNTLTGFGGAGLAAGRVGQAASLYGTTDGYYVDTPGGASLNFAGTAWSVNLWCNNQKSTATSSGTMILAHKRYGTTWGGFWCNYGLWMGKSGTGHNLVGPMYWNPGGILYPATGDLPLPALETSVWHMATVAWNGATATYYWDGQLVTSVAAVLPPGMQDSPYRFIIGNGDSPGTANAPGNAWVGMIDEVAVFNSVLSAPDVSAMYAAAPPATLGTFREEVLARNPVGYWEFKGNPNDSSGNGNTLTLNGSAGYASATIATGLFGQAASLGATSSDGFYVATPPGGSSLNIGGTNWSVNLWFNPADGAADNPLRTRVLIAKRTSTSGAWPWLTYGFFLEITGSPSWVYQYDAIMHDGAQGTFSSPALSAIGANEWHMGTCSFSDPDGAGGAWGMVTYYLDGTPLGSVTLPGTLPLPAAYRFIIGNDGAVGDSGYGGNFFKGMIDEVAVFGTALTGADVYDLYTAAHLPPPPPKGTVIIVR